MWGDLFASVVKDPSGQIRMPEKDLFDQVGQFCCDHYDSNPTSKKEEETKKVTAHPFTRPDHDA